LDLKHVNIKNHYELGKAIGKGAFGNVLIGQDKKTGIKRAIKILPIKVQNQKQINIILEEINLIKNLDHPYIIRVIESFQDKDNIYIVFEYIMGGNLSQIIKN
jgi:calcium-dependent protein kinase